MTLIVIKLPFFNIILLLYNILFNACLFPKLASTEGGYLTKMVMNKAPHFFFLQGSSCWAQLTTYQRIAFLVDTLFVPIQEKTSMIMSWVSLNPTSSVLICSFLWDVIVVKALWKLLGCPVLPFIFSGPLDRCLTGQKCPNSGLGSGFL